MKYRKVGLILAIILLGFPTIWIVCAILSGSLMPIDELVEKAGGVFTDAPRLSWWGWFPQYPTGKNYMELLFHTPGFYITFWNSYLQTAAILLLQAVVGIPAAWAFAVFSFRGKRVLFFFYLIWMILPFQILMLPEYMVLSRLSLMNTCFAVILPAGFSTFCVVILKYFFEGIPEEILEAARIDGACNIRILLDVGIPLGKGGILSVGILFFLENYNAIERPMNFLTDKSLWPLSIYLPTISGEKLSVAFAAAGICMLPCLLIFLNGQEYLEQGIAQCGLKM